MAGEQRSTSPEPTVRVKRDGGSILVERRSAATGDWLGVYFSRDQAWELLGSLRTLLAEEHRHGR